MSLRRKARETALQILYKTDISEGRAGEGPFEFDSLVEGTEARRYCETLVTGISAKRDELDAVIEKHSENWTVERMAVVDRNVLRIAVYELMYSEDVPYKVAIDEAVELAKLYGTEESGAFINGIIDKVRKSLGKKPPGTQGP